MSERFDGEKLLDDYLDALMAGEDPSPQAWLKERGLESDQWLRHLESVRRTVRDAASVPRPPNGDAPSVRQLDEFRLLDKLGEGGMGVVYLAEQRSLDRRVALKVLRPEHFLSQTAIARFEREGRAIARLHHPSIVKVHSIGECEGQRYLAMEFVEGRGLNEHLRESREGSRLLDVRDVLTWMRDLADALQTAHDNGIIHRDVKPSNIRITTEGRALLLDFGIARELDVGSPSLTQSFLGSPNYMAPEQIAREGGDVDGRTDVYGLGITLFECLTSQAPYQGESLERIFHDILEKDPISPRVHRRSLSKDIETVTLKATAKTPGDRYASAGAFRDDLNAILEFRPIRAHSQSVVSRWLKRARRHPVTSLALVLAVLSIPLTWATLAMFESQELEAKALSTLDDAGHRVESYEQTIEELRDLELMVADLVKKRERQYLTPEEDRVLADKEDEVDRRKVARAESFHEILDSLRLAERQGAEPNAVSELRGRLYLARSREAAANLDPSSQEAYRALALRNDPRGNLRARVSQVFPITLRSNPPGADVHLFRLVSQSAIVPGGEHRLVAAPYLESESVITPGTFALRVVKPSGDLERGALIVEVEGHPIRDAFFVLHGEGEIGDFHRLVSVDDIAVISWHEVARHALERTYMPRVQPLGRRPFQFDDGDKSYVIEAQSAEELGIVLGTAREAAERGGAIALVWDRGELSEVLLEEGLEVRLTASPLVHGEGSLIGKTPLELSEILQGDYLVQYRLSGYEDLLRPLTVGTGGNRSIVNLETLGTTPEGFVAANVWHSDQRFFMKEHEVTFGEYIEFLNDPLTLETIRRATTPILVPRSGVKQEIERLSRTAEGNFELPTDWPEDLPVFGVSWNDAKAYAQWKTRLADEQGLPYVYRIPTEELWISATGGPRYGYGTKFYPKWISSCFSKPSPFPARVMSFPIDQSRYGVFDVCGNMSEWIDKWWLEDRGFRWHAGGSWADGGPIEIFSHSGGNGLGVDEVRDSIGFRVAIEIDESGS